MPSGQAESAEFAEKRRGRKSRALHCGRQKAPASGRDDRSWNLVRSGEKAKG
jgi:hypothetical protein